MDVGVLPWMRVVAAGNTRLLAWWTLGSTIGYRAQSFPRRGKGEPWQERMERVIWSQRPEAPLFDDEIERLRADVIQSFEPIAV